MKKQFVFAITLVLLCASAFNLTLPVSAAEAIKEITVHGNLKRTVEAGGWVVATADQKYLILNWQKFKDQPWFTEGSEVEATGEVKAGVITTAMEGTPFEASSMRPFAQS